MNRKGNPYLALIALLLLAVILVCTCTGWTQPTEVTEPVKAPTTTTSTTTTTTTAPTTTTATVSARFVEYELTAEERELVESVVMAEAGSEPFEGQMAVAQCILNASRLTDTRPTDVVVDFKYAKSRPVPTAEVEEAVAAVFDDGRKVFDDEVLFFYAPRYTYSEWHESQTFVGSIGGHKFFKKKVSL